MSDAEEGIARTQAAAIKAHGTQGGKLREHQEHSATYLDERILTYVFAIAFIGLIVVWATTTSALILYGSLAAVILLIVLWGVARVKRIERTRQERTRQTKEWESEN
jgi:ABC-type transport system involved in cytochrome bd biosynthesis fused ATPase/permease subunit